MYHETLSITRTYLTGKKKRLTLIVDQARNAKLHELGDLVAILQPYALDQFSYLQYLESRLR